MPNTSFENSETQKQTVLCMIPYFGWIAALGFLFLEKKGVVKWYAYQSLVLHAILAMVQFFAIPLMKGSVALGPIANIIQGLVSVGFLVLCLYSCLQLYNAKMYKIPVISEFVDMALKKTQEGHGKK